MTGPRPRVGACTVVTGAHRAQAAVLAAGFVEHHPGAEFVVVVADRLDATEIRHDGWSEVGGGWLDLPPGEQELLGTVLSRAALLEALVAPALRRLLASVEVAMYLEPSSWVRGELAEVVQLAQQSGLVLSPRNAAPLPADGWEPSEESMAPEGFFAGGFVALTRSGAALLAPWSDAVVRSAAPLRGRAFDRVPAQLAHAVSADPRLGLAYWNAHERPPDADPALAVLRGYDPDRPWLLSTQCRNPPRVLLSERPDLRRLCDTYRELLLTERQKFPASEPYGFARMADGTRLTAAMRAALHGAWLRTVVPDRAGRRSEEPLPTSAFAADGGAAFRAWLAEPANPPQAAAGLNRLLVQTWEGEADLHLRFADPFLADAADFRAWAQSKAARRLVPSWARPGECAPQAPPRPEFGVNVVGTLRTEHGLGEMGRLIHRAVEAAGIPTRAVVDTHWMAERCRSDLAAPAGEGRPVHPVTVLAMNGNVTRLALSSNPEIGAGRYVIGVWAWELPEFPEFMREGLEHLDEIWAISEFTRASIAAGTDLPVKTVPLPVPVPAEPTLRTRAVGDPVTFLFAFDFNSTGGRKNPWGVVEAFRRAFPDRADARLVVKATNGRRHAAARERLRDAAAGDPRVTILETFLSPTELDELYAGADAYVSLHRAEGFGLTVAEAMARGMPVVSTDWSSTSELVDETTGWPVPCTVIEIGPGWSPYPPDAHWADPDLDAAAAAMRRIADDPEEARRRGAAARAHLERTRSLESSAAWVARELRAAYAVWQAREAPPERRRLGRWNLPRPGS